MPGPSSSTVTTIHSRGAIPSEADDFLFKEMRTVPPGSENEHALSIRLLTTWPRRRVVPKNKERRAWLARATRFD